MKKLREILIYIVVLFVLLQYPLSVVFQKDFYKDTPMPNWTSLMSGEFGSNIERYFSENSFLAVNGAQKYREIIYKYFLRSNKKVLIGKNNFLFEKIKMGPIVPDSKLNASLITQKILEIKSKLEAHGSKLTMLLIPNRANIYADYVYDDGVYEPSRDIFGQDILSRLRQQGLSIIDLTAWMKEKRKTGLQIFFKVDHHWTYKAVAELAPFVAAKLKEDNASLKAKKKIIFKTYWDEKTSAHDKIARKLGFGRSSIPNKFKEKQWIPSFNLDRDKIQNQSTENLMVISSSFARYGLIEFLSNELGYALPFYIERGRGANYGIEKLFLRHIIKEEKMIPKHVLWVISEGELFGQGTRNDIPNIFDFEKKQNINFELKDISGGELAGNTLSHLPGKLSFTVHLKSKKRRLILAIKTKSRATPSRLKFMNEGSGHESYTIIHDGETDYYFFETDEPTQNFHFNILTPFHKRLTGGRKFEISGVFTF